MLNLGIVAHVDAGKTSLTERLLHAAGVIEEIGSVDAGNTQTDSLALERQRGITIKSAVASFVVSAAGANLRARASSGARAGGSPVGDVTVNLIDTPGHPDFIAEVERVLSVLDGAVLVISAVEGVQPQTRVLMRTLHRLRIPTVIFVNKIDRGGAQAGGTVRAISAKLTPAIVAMGSAHRLGSRNAFCTPYSAADADFRSRLVELLAENDDALLAAYLNGQTAVSYRRLRRALAAQTGRALVHPVFFGSAITGAGVDALTAGITELLPAAGGDPGGPVSGTVFKVERGPAGERVGYVRMFSGTVRTRDRVRTGPDGAAKVTAIGVFDRGTVARRDAVTAGQIGKLWGLGEVRIGDWVGRPPTAAGGARHFPPPTLETVVVPARAADRGPLLAALTQLTEQDPLINMRQDDVRQEIVVSLYGEVQKEVIQATLAAEFGIEVGFRESTTVCIERPVGTGAAVELISDDANPFHGTVGLRVDPAPVGSGVRYRLAVELGSMPYAFFAAVEETVHATLRQGLYGWQVTDCTVTMTHSGYWPRQSHAHGTFDPSMSSTAGDFRNLTPLVLMTALRRAGTRVYEPLHRFHLEVPVDTSAAVLKALAGLRAVPQSTAVHSPSYHLDGEIPAARVHDLHRQLPALTRGEGALDSTFDHYQQVRGETPTRPRTDHNPLNREEYLLHVQRRVQRLS